MHITLHPLAKAGTAIAAFAALLALSAPPASAASTFTTATILPGSSFTIGSQTFGVGTAACNDGEDNDKDSLTDYPNDPECDSAIDASERINGVQTYNAPTVSGTYNDVTDTFSGVSLNFPPSELCVTSTQCLTVTISDLGGATGTLTGANGTFNIAVKVDLDAAVGFGGLPAACAINPIPKAGGLAAINTTNYSNTTGNATYAATGIGVPQTSGCGFIYGPVINTALGLSSTSTADLNFLVDFNPVIS